jgi:hypothetical protein
MHIHLMKQALIIVVCLPVMVNAAVIGADGNANPQANTTFSGAPLDAQSAPAASPQKAPTIGGNINSLEGKLNPPPTDSAASTGASGKRTSNHPTGYNEPDPMLNGDTLQIIMDSSIAAFHGYCACPYSVNRDGFECGVESAYYKPGGYRIDCFPQDVRGQQIIFYRKTH